MWKMDGGGWGILLMVGEAAGGGLASIAAKRRGTLSAHGSTGLLIRL